MTAIKPIRLTREERAIAMWRCAIGRSNYLWMLCKSGKLHDAR